MEDLYGILDVPKDASTSDIKRAYKKMSMQHHPDRNNNSELSKDAMVDINMAYDVLSNPERREQYDRTGDGSVKPRVETIAMNELSKLFAFIVEQCQDLESTNIILEMIKTTNHNMRSFKGDIQKHQINISKYEKAKTRIVRKSGENMLSAVLAEKINASTIGIANLEINVDVSKSMLEMIDSYEYNFTEKQTYSGNQFYTTGA